jgi:hypothetical protein
MTDVLTAIDDALETGLAAHPDPELRDLQELGLLLRADAPEPSSEYCEWLDDRVEEGFAKPKKPRPLQSRWSRFGGPALATSLVALPLVLIVILAGGSGTATDEGGGGGGGGGAAESGDAGGGSVAASGGGGATAGPEAIDPNVAAKSGRRADRALSRSFPGIAIPQSGRGFAPGRSDRKIERSVALELEMPVDEMARVAEQVTTVTNRHGGFVLSSSVSTGDDSAGGDFDLRIPAAELRPALRDLAALADVRTQSQTGRDVTREHVTARDRLRAARAERRSLLRRLEVATTDEEAEAIRRRLDLVAGEINGLRGQLRNLRLRTDYAVVTVSLLPKNGDQGGAGGGGSFDDAVGDAGDILVATAGVIVRVLAVALPLGLIALLGWLGARVVRRRQRESALA